MADGHAWLVGYHGGLVPLIQEWDGHAWRERQPPADCLRGGTSFGGMLTFCNITSVTAFAPNDVWAAGNGAWQGFRGPLLLHWDGRSWQTVQVGINRQDYSFSAIGGTSGTDLWAAAGPRGGTLVMHFDGRSAQAVGRLSDTGLVELPKLITDTAGRPWLIEDFNQPSAALATYNPANGWTAMQAPRPDGAVGNAVNGITAVPGTSLMLAVGYADLPTTPRTLKAIIMEYSNPATPTATTGPVGSPTPAGSTTPG